MTAQKTHSFGPSNPEEALVFAVEELRADIQYALLAAMREEGMTQARLAERLGMSPAAVSQFLGDDANLTIESVAKLFLGLERQCVVQSRPLAQHFGCMDEMSQPDGPARWFQEEFKAAERSKSIFDPEGLIESLRIAATHSELQIIWANDNEASRRAEFVG